MRLGILDPLSLRAVGDRFRQILFDTTARTSHMLLILVSLMISGLYAPLLARLLDKPVLLGSGIEDIVEGDIVFPSDRADLRPELAKMPHSTVAKDSDYPMARAHLKGHLYCCNTCRY